VTGKLFCELLCFAIRRGKVAKQTKQREIFAPANNIDFKRKIFILIAHSITIRVVSSSDDEKNIFSRFLSKLTG
jgi:hypothetical protein